MHSCPVNTNPTICHFQFTLHVWLPEPTIPEWLTQGDFSLCWVQKITMDLGVNSSPFTGLHGSGLFPVM